MPPLIECHAHVLPDTALARFPDGGSPRYGTAERRVLSRMLEAQDANGITHALVSDSFFMETSAEALPSWPATDRARLYNDELAALLARHPKRLRGLGCVDPWAGEAAARELERMVTTLGFVGALVNPSDGRRYLDDPACAPLLAAAERLGRPLFVHPTRDLPAGEHYKDFVMSLIMGRPTQTAVCAARLIFTGTLDRHPRLPLLLAHGGGVLPFVAGRLDATWTAYRPDRWEGPDLLTAAPSSYLRRFHVDTNVWSTAALRLQSMGVSETNYARYKDPVLDDLFLKQARALDPEERRRTLRAFERRLLDEEVRYIYTLQWHRIVPHSAKVRGWTITPAHFLNQQLDTVWLAE